MKEEEEYVLYFIYHEAKYSISSDRRGSRESQRDRRLRSTPPSNSRDAPCPLPNKYPHERKYQFPPNPPPPPTKPILTFGPIYTNQGLYFFLLVFSTQSRANHWHGTKMLREVTLSDPILKSSQKGFFFIKKSVNFFN